MSDLSPSELAQVPEVREARDTLDFEKAMRETGNPLPDNYPLIVSHLNAQCAALIQQAREEERAKVAPVGAAVRELKTLHDKALEETDNLRRTALMWDCVRVQNKLLSLPLPEVSR